MKRFPLRIATHWILSLCLASPVAPATAQNQTADPPESDEAPIEVMVVGTYHFAGSEADAVDSQIGDVTTPERQAQVRRVVDSLVSFQPTKVAVERLRANAAEVDSLYDAYRDGNHALEPSEDQQLGFRVADRLNLGRVHAIDWRNDWPFDPVLAHARKHQPSFIEYFETWRGWFKTRMDSLGQRATVGEALRWFNRPGILSRLHAPDIRMLEVGADSSFVGLEPTAKLYRRNLRIFANLTRVAEPGDRVLVIYGANHASYFREFIGDHPQMRVIDPLDYL
jgi:hypothetical protein